MKTKTLFGLFLLHFAVGSCWAQQGLITKVYAWGVNTSGQCNVPADLTNAVEISAGNAHCLALRADGTVAAWGDNTYGQCSVPAGLTNAVAISAGYSGSLAVKADGTVVAWGKAPALPSGLTNVIAVSLGGAHALALTRNGEVLTWYDANNPNRYELKVPPGLSDIVAVSAGLGPISGALRNDGTAVGWGYSVGGEIGFSGVTNAVALHVGWPSLVLLSDGSVLTRGILDNWAQVPPTDLTNAVAVAGWYYLNLALLADGTLRSWGVDQGFGELNVPSSPSGFTKISAGSGFGLALAYAMKPIIEKSPRSRTVVVGSPVEFQVLATGARPLLYQWYHGTELLVNVTNTTLRIESVQPDDSGVYTVKVSNSEGEAVSDPAMLTVVPAVDLAMVPAINLKGGLSSVYRIEYLSQIGPTNSWIPLATVTITNQPQYFIDMSAMGLPARFYRLVDVSP